MDKIQTVLQRSPLRVELCKPRPSAEVARRSLAFVHSSCAAQGDLSIRLPDPLVSGGVPRRVPRAAAIAEEPSELQTASTVSHREEESLTGSNLFQRLGLDHRLTVRPWNVTFPRHNLVHAYAALCRHSLEAACNTEGRCLRS